MAPWPQCPSAAWVRTRKPSGRSRQARASGSLIDSGTGSSSRTTGISGSWPAGFWAASDSVAQPITSEVRKEFLISRALRAAARFVLVVRALRVLDLVPRAHQLELVLRMDLLQLGFGHAHAFLRLGQGQSQIALL